MLDHTATTRICCLCHQDKPIEAFYWRDKKRNKRRGHCRKCQDKKTVSWGRRNKKHLRETNRKWRHANPDKIKEYDAKARSKPEYREGVRRRYRQNPERGREHTRRYRLRHKMTIQERLRIRLSNQINKGLRRHGIPKKSNPTLALVGCGVQEFMKHLESLWLSGMSWDNWGTYRVDGPMTWHIDHKRPCSSFDLTDPAQQRECFHYTNTQPLWALDNMTKSDRYTP